MIGVLITAIAAFLREAGMSIGKTEFNHRHENIFSLGFINALIGTLFFVIISLTTGTFVLSPDSFPTLFTRIILEVALLYVSLKALVISPRSTFSFIRILTLPLLLLVDILVGYTLSLPQIIGMGIIIISLFLLYSNSYINHKGSKWCLWSAILAVITTSLYKYNITFYNSVAAEQTVVLISLLSFLFFASIFIKKQNPFLILKEPTHILQALSYGAGSVIVSYAYIFAPASVIMSAKRAFGVLAATLSGHFYFHEKKLYQKLLYFVLVALGIFLLVV